jgi:hypothetical protein
LRVVALAAGISRRVLCDTRVIFITIIAIYIALAEKIGTPLIMKTKQSGTLLDDLKETFANLRRYRMKLNPEKCTFGVPAG